MRGEAVTLMRHTKCTSTARKQARNASHKLHFQVKFVRGSLTMMQAKRMLTVISEVGASP